MGGKNQQTHKKNIDWPANKGCGVGGFWVKLDF